MGLVSGTDEAVGFASVVPGVLVAGALQAERHNKTTKTQISKLFFISIYSKYMVYWVMLRATYTPLADAWDREWVMPLPSPMMYRPG